LCPAGAGAADPGRPDRGAAARGAGAGGVVGGPGAGCHGGAPPPPTPPGRPARAPPPLPPVGRFFTASAHGRGRPWHHHKALNNTVASAHPGSGAPFSLALPAGKKRRRKDDASLTEQ